MRTIHKKQLTIIIPFLNEKDEVANTTSDIGLWTGKMGVALYPLHFARVTQNEEYEKIASQFIAEVSGRLSYETPFSYADGLLGIGCGFEYITACLIWFFRIFFVHLYCDQMITSNT